MPEGEDADEALAASLKRLEGSRVSGGKMPNPPFGVWKLVEMTSEGREHSCATADGELLDLFEAIDHPFVEDREEWDFEEDVTWWRNPDDLAVYHLTFAPDGRFRESVLRPHPVMSSSALATPQDFSGPYKSDDAEWQQSSMCPLYKEDGYIFAAEPREAGDSFLRSDASLEPSPKGEALIVNDLGKSWGDMELIDRIRWTSEGLERENFMRWDGMHLVVVRQRYVPLLTFR